MELASLVALPGVLQSAVADDAGNLLASAGDGAPHTTATLVLAHATFAAADELGSRAGCGSCAEIIQQHENSVIYIRSLARRRLLLVRCQTADAVPAIRAASRSMDEPEVSVETKTTAPVLDLTSALHAEPSW